jgi:hypothetical protein
VFWNNTIHISAFVGFNNWLIKGCLSKKENYANRAGGSQQYFLLRQTKIAATKKI